jgi:hypothetical protein
MENNNKESLGKIVVGYGSPEEKSIEIKDYIQAGYIDHRVITVAALEDDSYVLTVENPVSTGRASQQSIRLSHESFIGLIHASFLYFGCKGIEIGEELKKCVSRDDIEYSYSDNLHEYVQPKHPTDDNTTGH